MTDMLRDPASFATSLDSLFRAHCIRLDVDEPWFARVALDKGGDVGVYFIGHRRHPDERILDWQHPLAKAYYEAEPGEEFELDHPRFKNISGIVESHCAITSAERRVRKLTLKTPHESFVLVAGDEGFVSPDETPAARAAQAGLGDILGLITKAQYRLITSSRNQPLIVQGRAGSGKTSVALYRVAWLTWPGDDASEAPIDPLRVLIVMFNKALSTFVRGTVEKLKLDGVQLDTFHGWALDAIRRAYRGQIDVSTTNHPGKANAAMLKKQIGILHATDAFVQRQIRALERWLEEKLAPYDADGQFLTRFRELDIPVARKIGLMRAMALRGRDAAKTSREQKRLAETYAVFAQAMKRMTLYKEELFKLFTDRALLEEHLPSATGEQLDDLIRYQTALQREGAQEKRLGTKVSFEDLAILLRLMHLKHGGLPNKDREDEVHVFDHLVIDEAQDFGAVELMVLLGSVRSRTGVTIVGDVNQKIVPEADFIGWEALAKELGMSGAQVAKLEVPHRSTAPIMAVADAIVGDEPSAGRPGPRPRMTLVEKESVLEKVADIARDSVKENPNAHVCVIARHVAEAKGAHDELSAMLADLPVAVRLGHNRDFEFGAGVTVTNMRQVKGLEFETVIVLEPTEANYPDSEDGRRALYTMVTRAKDALHFVGSDAPCVVLRKAIDDELVDLNDETDVPPVTFDEEDEEPF